MSAAPLRAPALERPVPSSPVGWAYAGAAALGALGLWRYVNPWNGEVARRWPWAIPLPPDWTKAFAIQTFFLLLVLAPLVAMFRPARPRRGVGVALAVGLALAALATLARGRGTEASFHYGVETYVPPLLAALAAAGLYASRTGGALHVAATAAGSVLLLLLVYPHGGGTRSMVPGRNSGYFAPLADLVTEVVSRAGLPEEYRRAALEAGVPGESVSAVDVLVHPWSVGVLLSLVAGACAVGAAVKGPRRWLVGLGVAAFVGIALYPSAWTAIDVLRRPEVHLPSLSRGEAVALDLGFETRVTYAPFLLALFGAATDLLRRRENGPARP